MNKKTPWRPIKTAKKAVLQEIDLWLIVHASPMSMGMGDSFRVPAAYWMEDQTEEYRNPSMRDDHHAGWFHMDRDQHRRINDDYITHWMPIPKAPQLIK